MGTKAASGMMVLKGLADFYVKGRKAWVLIFMSMYCLGGCSILKFFGRGDRDGGNARHGKECKLGVEYDSVQVGVQVWMSRNLDVSCFRNGEEIPEARSAEEWRRAAEEGCPAWCYYDNDPENGKIYGKLYNWYAVVDPRGLAPEGWRIPTVRDFEVLKEYIGGSWIDADALIYSEWYPTTNTTGFRAMLGGFRLWNGEFGMMGEKVDFWAIDTFRGDSRMAYALSLSFFDFIGSECSWLAPSSKKNGYYVRCIREGPARGPCPP